jgi:fatty acid-binding protein DegV
VVRLVERAREKIKIFVAVSTFRYMIRSGRVSPLKGFIASALNLKPIVAVQLERT